MRSFISLNRWRARWRAFCHPIDPERAELLRSRWASLPQELTTSNQLSGRHLTHCVFITGASYFQNLEAPSGKRFVWFEKSGHWPRFEQAKNYREEIQSVLLAEKRKKTDCRFLSD
jgi:hypothetical protein